MPALMQPFERLLAHARMDALFVVMLLAIVAVSASGQAQAQDFTGAFDGMRNSNEPVQIEADRLEVVDGQGVAVFDGNVAVVQGSTILKTRVLKAFYARDANGNAGPGGNLRRIEASGKVAVRSNDQVATADSVVVDMGTQIATLSGNVSISQGENIITGCVVTVNMKTNNVQVKPCNSGSGRVKVLLQPQN